MKWHDWCIEGVPRGLESLITKVESDHNLQVDTGRGGHDFLHTVMVALFAEKIALIEYSDNISTAKLAWTAGIMHSTDRLFFPEKVEKRLRDYYLSSDIKSFSKEESEIIIQAVLDHNKINDDNDHPVTIVLKDADRLALLGAQTFIRSGAFFWQKPAFDPRFIDSPDPDGNYKDPKTALDDIHYMMEWVDKSKPKLCLRTKTAWQLAEPHIRFMDLAIENIKLQMQQLGLAK